MSYQWLSNELQMDAWLSREVLSRFVEKHRSSLDVLWLLSGLTTAVNRVLSPPARPASHKGGVAHSSSPLSSSPSSDTGSLVIDSSDDSGQSLTAVHEVTLVSDSDVEEVKAAFTSVYSLHPYSVMARPQDGSLSVVDVSAVVATLQSQQLLAMYDEADLLAANPLRDGRYSAVDPGDSIHRSKRGRGGVAKAADSGRQGGPSAHSRPTASTGDAKEERESDQEEKAEKAVGSAKEAKLPARSPPLNGFSSLSSSAGKAGAKKPSNALASMFSKQTALMQDALPPSAQVTPHADDLQALQSNATTVLPAESPKADNKKAQSPADKRNETKGGSGGEEKESSAAMQVDAQEAEESKRVREEEEDDVVEETPQKASRGAKSPPSKKATAKSREGGAKAKAKAKPKPKAKARGTKRKADEDEADHPDPLPEPYESSASEAEPSVAGEEAAVEEEEAAYNADDFVPSSVRDVDDDDGAKPALKSFFPVAPAGASPSALLPSRKKKVQRTYTNDAGYFVVEMVEEEDEEAERQRKAKEAEEEVARNAADSRRREQKERERREKEKAEEEERLRMEQEKRDKREAKKEEKKAAKAAGAEEGGKKRKADDEDVEAEVEERGGKKAKKGSPKGATQGGAKERAKEAGTAPKADDKGKEKAKGPGKAAEAKPKNNSSILSFFSKK